MASALGQSYPAGGYVRPGEVRVLAVSNVAQHAAHEFCHIVSLNVNPTIANNPRWVWESVALFENRQFVDPRSLDYLVRGVYPTLAQLNADFNTSRQVYEVGYLIGEFIVDRWGQHALVELIRTNGDLAAVLGLSTNAFEQQWQAFIRGRYF